MTNFNTTIPTPGRHSRWIDIEAGWEHDLDGDDIVILADANGLPIPRVWRFPATLTARQIQDAVRSIGETRLVELTQQGGIDAAVELVGAVIGPEIVMALATDPTVAPEVFGPIILKVIDAWGLGEAVPPSDTPNQPAPTGAASSDSPTA